MKNQNLMEIVRMKIAFDTQARQHSKDDSDKIRILYDGPEGAICAVPSDKDIGLFRQGLNDDCFDNEIDMPKNSPKNGIYVFLPYAFNEKEIDCEYWEASKRSGHLGQYETYGISDQGSADCMFAEKERNMPDGHFDQPMGRLLYRATEKNSDVALELVQIYEEMYTELPHHICDLKPVRDYLLDNNIDPTQFVPRLPLNTLTSEDFDKLLRLDEDLILDAFIEDDSFRHLLQEMRVSEIEKSILANTYGNKIKESYLQTFSPSSQNQIQEPSHLSFE